MVSTCDLGGKVFPSNKQRDGTKSVLESAAGGHEARALYGCTALARNSGGVKKGIFKEERASAAALQGGKKRKNRAEMYRYCMLLTG